MTVIEHDLVRRARVGLCGPAELEVVVRPGSAVPWS